MLIGKATNIAILENLILRFQTIGFISISRDNFKKYLLSSTFWGVLLHIMQPFRMPIGKATNIAISENLILRLQTRAAFSISMENFKKYLLSSTFWGSFANNATFSNADRKSNKYFHFSKFNPSLTNNRVHFHFKRQL